MLYRSDSSARVIIDALQRTQDVRNAEAISPHVALLALVQLPVADTILPRVLCDDTVWPPAHREQVWKQVNDGQISYSGKVGTFLPPLIANIEARTAAEAAPVVVEHYVVDALADFLTSGDNRGFGVNVDALRARVGQLSGRMTASEEDRQKTWLVADTNLFLEYTFFIDVAWNTELGHDRVVLVVPAAMIRELDAFKVDPRRERQHRRTRQVLPRLREIAFAAPPRTPAPVRDGVELRRLGREPSASPDGRDPPVPDNRLIAAALEFRWNPPGLVPPELTGVTLPPP